MNNIAKELQLNKVEKAMDEAIERYTLIQHRLKRRFDKSENDIEDMKLKNAINSIDYRLNDMDREIRHHIKTIEQLLIDTYEFPSEQHWRGIQESNKESNPYELGLIFEEEGFFQLSYTYDNKQFILEIEASGEMYVSNEELSTKIQLYTTYNLNKKLADAAETLINQ